MPWTSSAESSAASTGARFTKWLKALQSALGRLNDIEVHKCVADTIVHHERSPRRVDKALAMGFVSGYEQTQIKPCLAAVTKARRRLADISPFWDKVNRDRRD